MIFDINNNVLVLNGHTVRGGYSDDADALMFEVMQLVASARTGADGTKAFFGMADRGGPFTLKLLPTSPSIPFFQQQAEIVRKRGSVIWNGSLRDVQRGISVTMTFGVMISYPPYPSYGKESVANYEYAFEFEELESDHDTPTAGAFRAIGAAA